MFQVEKTNGGGRRGRRGGRTQKVRLLPEGRVHADQEEEQGSGRDGRVFERRAHRRSLVVFDAGVVAGRWRRRLRRCRERERRRRQQSVVQGRRQLQQRRRRGREQDHRVHHHVQPRPRGHVRPPPAPSTPSPPPAPPPPTTTTKPEPAAATAAAAADDDVAVVAGDRRRRAHHQRPVDRGPAHAHRDEREPGERTVRGAGGPGQAEARKKRIAGGETRTEGGQDAGHHHRGVRRVLAAVLHHGPGHAPVQRLFHQRIRVQFLLVAGLLQLHAEPDHLHRVQSGVPVGVHENDLRHHVQEIIITRHDCYY